MLGSVKASEEVGDTQEGLVAINEDRASTLGDSKPKLYATPKTAESRQWQPVVSESRIKPFQQEVTFARPTRYLEPFFAYRKTLIVCLLISILTGWLALVLWPRSYESTAKLQLLVGRESVGLDPSSTTTQTLLMQKSLEEDVNSALEILGSREVAEQVVREIGSETIIAGALPESESNDSPSALKDFLEGSKSRASDWFFHFLDLSGVRDPVNDHERAIVRLQDRVQIHAPQKSSTMIISAEAKSPEVAQQIVNSYIKHFIDKHVDVTTTSGSFAFFEQQASEAENDLSHKMRKKSDLLQQHRLASTSSRFAALADQQSTIEATILSTEAAIQQANAELDDLTDRLADLDEEIVSAKQTQPDQTVIGMRISLYNAELEEKLMLARYREDHPKLKQVQEQVAAAREALDKLERDSQSQSLSPNPIHMKMEEDLLKTKTRIAGLESMLAKSQKQLDEKLREIHELLDLELKLEALDRDIEVARKNLATLREKEEQSRVVESLRLQRISSIGIAQPATLAFKPSKPKKPLIAAAALFLGCGLGIGLVVLKEGTRQTFRNSHDVKKFLGYPVLAEVPRIPTLAKKSLRKIKFESSKTRQLRKAVETLQSELWLSGSKGLPQDHPGRTVGFLGVHEDCGASTLAIALALQYSQNNRARTTLIDLDPDRGSVMDFFGLNSRSEIAHENNATTPQETNEQTFQVPDRSLNLIASSSPGLTQSGEAGSSSNSDCLKSLDSFAENSEVVILDFPPLSRPQRSLAMAGKIDQVVLVLEAEKTTIDSAAKVLSHIENIGGEVAGVVLCKTRRYVPSWVEKLLG